MKTILLALLVSVAPLAAQINLDNASTALFTAPPLSLVTRTVAIPGHFFVVQYEYSTSWASVPAVGGAKNHPHYDAKVKVFEIVSGESRPLGEAFSGQYTDEGCFEDDPDSLVLHAAEKAGLAELVAQLKKGIKAKEEKAAYERMPLFQEENGSLVITPKGKAELVDVRIDGKVLWKGTARPKPSTASTLICATEGCNVAFSKGMVTSTR